MFASNLFFGAAEAASELAGSAAGSTHMWIGVAIFAAAYLFIASEKVDKTIAAMLGAGLMIALGVAGFNDMLGKIDLNVLGLLIGMMVIVNIMATTGVFEYLAVKIARQTKGNGVLVVMEFLLATAFISAFMDNVTTVILMAPVTILITQLLRLPTVPILIMEAIFSNIGGTATLIGDPPNLIIGSIAGLNFADFLINLAPFIIVVMAIYCICLWVYYSKRMHVTVEKRALIMELDERAAITDWSNLRRGGIVMVLTIFGFLVHGALGLQPCVVAMAGATLALLICKVDVDHALEKIEWSTLFFFMALFILVCGAEYCGLMEKIGGLMSLMDGWPVPVVVLVIMWVSALAAAVMNNVSFTAAMVTVVAAFISSTPAFNHSMECRNLLWWGLALAVCLGGNASLVGAAANLVTVGIAEKNGHQVGFMDFLKYGVPVTLGSMVLASAYILARYYVTCTA